MDIENINLQDLFKEFSMLEAAYLPDDNLIDRRLVTLLMSAVSSTLAWKKEIVSLEQHVILLRNALIIAYEMGQQGQGELANPHSIEAYIKASVIKNGWER